MHAAAAAIADPVRRGILDALVAGPLPAGEIAARFDVSRPAVSRHLRVLREAGVVRDEPVGRERVYTLTPEPLRPVATWIAGLDRAALVESRLDALDLEVRRTGRDRRRAAASGEAVA